MAVRLTLGIASEPVASLRCECSEVIVKSHGETEKVRAKILIIKGKNVFAVCKRCNAEVPLPLQKTLPAKNPQPPKEEPPTAPDPGPALILRK